MKKILIILFVILSVISNAQVNQYTVRAKNSLQADSLLILGRNKDTLNVAGANDFSVIQKINGSWGFSEVNLDSILHAIYSDTATVAIKTQVQTNIARVDQNGKGDYYTIQGAIDSVKDQSGIWQIQISEGVYSEQITLYDSIQLVGVDDDMVIITSTSPVITFAAEKSAIKDVTIVATSATPALVATNSSSTSEIKIQNCDLNVVCCVLDIDSDGLLFFLDNNITHINASTAALTSNIIELTGDLLFISNSNSIIGIDNRASGNMTMIYDASTNRSIYGEMFIDLSMTNASFADTLFVNKFLGNDAVDVQNTIQNYKVYNGVISFLSTIGGGDVQCEVSSSDLNFDTYSSLTGVLHESGDTVNINMCYINKELVNSGDGVLNFLVNQDGALITNEDIIDQNMYVDNSSNKSLNDYFNIQGNAGWVSGGSITVVTDSTVTIASGTGLIRTSNSDQAPLKMFNFPDTTNLRIPTLNMGYYAYVDYNNGDPMIKITTNSTLVLDNEKNLFELYEIVRESDTIHTIQHLQRAINLGGRLQRYFYSIDRIRRSAEYGGLIIGETGTRNVTLSGGLLWLKLNSFETPSLNTSTGDTFDRYYRDGSGGFTKMTGEAQWNNTQYDNGTGTLATMGASKWSFQDFWVDTEGQLVSMFGQGEYTSEALATTASRIGSLPERIESHGLYVGRIVFQINAATGTVLSAFTAIIGGSAAITSHNDLSGLNIGNYLHLTPSELAYIQNWADSVASATAVELNTAHRLADGDVSATNELNTSVTWVDASDSLSVIDAGGTKYAIITGFVGEEDLSGIRDTLVFHSDSLVDIYGRVVTLESATHVNSFNSRTGAVSPQLGDYTTTIVGEGTNLYYTDERAQDAVGSKLINSSSINLYYDDGTPSFSAAVVPAGVSIGGDLSGTVANAQIVAGTIVNVDINATANIDATKLGTGVISNTEFNTLNNNTENLKLLADTIHYNRDSIEVLSPIIRSLNSYSTNLPNMVTASSAFGADNRVLRSDGTGRGSQYSLMTVDDNGSPDIPSGQNYYIGGNQISSTNLSNNSNLVKYDDATKTFTGTGNTSFNGWVGIAGYTTPVGTEKIAINGGAYINGQTHVAFGLSPTNVITANATSSEIPLLTYINGAAGGGLGTDAQGTTYISSYFNTAMRTDGGFVFLSQAGNFGVGYSTGTEITNNKLAVNGSAYINGSGVLTGSLAIKTTVANTLEIGGTMRATGYDGAATGSGLELFYLSDIGYISAQNRDLNSYLPLYLRGSEIDLKIDGTTKFAINSSGNTTIYGTTNSILGYQKNSVNLNLDFLRTGYLGTSGQIPIGQGSGVEPVWTSTSSINISGFNNDAGFIDTAEVRNIVSDTAMVLRSEVVSLSSLFQYKSDTTTYDLTKYQATLLYEPIFAKNSGFNKNFGVIAGTVAQGNDSRFHDAITLATSATDGGLGLSTQQITFRAANNSQTGYATASHIQAIEANSGKDTTGIYHINRGVLNGVSATDTTNWSAAYSDRLKWDGGATGLIASTGRTSLGATIVGSNLFTLINPSAVTFIRVNADNTVSSLNASDFRISLGLFDSTQVKQAISDSIAAYVATQPIFAYHEVPSGSINGTNDTFTILHTPISSSEDLMLNGVVQEPVIDYTISGTTITFDSGNIPQTNDRIWINYKYTQ